MPTLINMQMDPEEAKEQCSPCCETDSKDFPKYPWGLEIHLDDKAVEKLGFDAKVGSQVIIVAKATVSGARSSQRQDGDTQSSCDLQITDMTVSAGSDTAEKLFGGK